MVFQFSGHPLDGLAEQAMQSQLVGGQPRLIPVVTFRPLTELVGDARGIRNEFPLGNSVPICGPVIENHCSSPADADPLR